MEPKNPEEREFQGIGKEAAQEVSEKCVYSYGRPMSNPFWSE